MVKKLFTDCGRTITGDVARSGCPTDVATFKTIKNIHDMVMAVRRLKVRDIVEDKLHDSVV